MVLGIAAVGTLFFGRIASEGIFPPMQAVLVADLGSVGLALVMTLLLPRAKSSAPGMPSARVVAEV